MPQRIKPGSPLDSKTDDRSPDTYARRLFKELRGRIEFLRDAHAYLENGPLGNEFEVDENQEFQGLVQLRNMSRNNYAKLVVSATTDRLGILGFRTSANSSEYGDEEASKAFEKDDMGVGAQEAQGLACAYRNAYLYVDPVTERQKVLPPTNAAVISDVSGEPAVALYIRNDRLLGKKVMTLFVRDIDLETGEAKGGVTMYVATRDSDLYDEDEDDMDGIRLTSHDSEIALDDSVGNNWIWWKQRELSIQRVPITPLKNKDGKNEFEDHTDVIDRINHMIFQRVIIVTMQAFRQRAVKGKFPEKDPQTGAKIDYNETFSPGPGNLWLLPEDADLWESTPPQFTEILQAVKDDTRDLASLTYTPMTYFSDNANQSAEGAGMQRENYTSKIEDRRRRFGPRWSRHLSVYFEIIGDTERSEQGSLAVIWQPIAADSLVQRAAAFQSLVTTGEVAVETAMREALGWTPREIHRAIQEQNRSKLRALAKPVNEPTPLARRSHSIPGNDNGGGKNNQKKEL